MSYDDRVVYVADESRVVYTSLVETPTVYISAENRVVYVPRQDTQDERIARIEEIY